MVYNLVVKHRRSAAMSIYIGLDAHSTTSTLVSLNEAGKVVSRCQVFVTQWRGRYYFTPAPVVFGQED
jgi:hypothetical protein